MRDTAKQTPCCIIIIIIIKAKFTLEHAMKAERG
jgi:hypothetical protein